MRTGLEALGFHRGGKGRQGKESWIRTPGANPFPDTEAKPRDIAWHRRPLSARYKQIPE